MIYLKSALAGLMALVAAAILAVITMSIYVGVVVSSKMNGTVGWDPISLMSWWIVVFAAAIFLLGFLWKLRHARKARE